MESRRGGGGGGESCCPKCCGFIITLGLAALFMWLSLRTNEPKCFVENFYVPALNQTLKSPSNSTILFTIGLDNGNKDKGIAYDVVNITFGIFTDRNKTKPIGNSTILGFYQGHQKNAKKPGAVEVNGGALNETVRFDNRTYFRVDIRTSVRYKILFWYKKRESLWGGGNVAVDDSGKKVGKKGVRLGHTDAVVVSGVTLVNGRYYCVVLVLSVFVSLLLFL